MKRSFCDVCGEELGKGHRSTGNYAKAHIEQPSVFIDISAARPIGPDRVSPEPLDICIYCVLDAVARLDDRARPA